MRESRSTATVVAGRVADALEQVAAGAARGIYRQGGDGAWAPVGDRELAGRRGR
jgi:hypothetical protein